MSGVEKKNLPIASGAPALLLSFSAVTSSYLTHILWLLQRTNTGRANIQRKIPNFFFFFPLNHPSSIHNRHFYSKLLIVLPNLILTNPTRHSLFVSLTFPALTDLLSCPKHFRCSTLLNQLNILVSFFAPLVSALTFLS